MSFDQDEYDKKFVRTINLLISNKDQHKLFKRADDLVGILGISSKSVLSEIRAGRRHVPKELRYEITKKLDDLVKRAGQKAMQSLVNDEEIMYSTRNFNKSVAEDLHVIKTNLATILENQRVMMAQQAAESVLAAQRHVGDDPAQLADELRKRDKLIGDFLPKGI
jgi:hypothetical protein